MTNPYVTPLSDEDKIKIDKDINAIFKDNQDAKNYFTFKESIKDDNKQK